VVAVVVVAVVVVAVCLWVVPFLSISIGIALPCMHVGRIYLFGGCVDDGGHVGKLTDMEMLDLNTGEWSTEWPADVAGVSDLHAKPRQSHKLACMQSGRDHHPAVLCTLPSSVAHALETGM
jgi:hypothetical protein